MKADAFLSFTSGRFGGGETAYGANSGAEGVLMMISAENLSPDAGKRLLKELMALYPLEALANI